MTEPEQQTKAPPRAGPAKPDRKPLPPYIAIWHALRGDEIDHYPQVLDGGRKALLETDAMMAEFAIASSHWAKLKDDGLDEAIKLARQSLDEVKDQTEYQDQKATRLLTVTTFLTALSGVLFTRLIDAYPLGGFPSQPILGKILLALSYALFGAFLLTALFGALITFHATRTRFKYVKDRDLSEDMGDPRSRLFYRGILHVRPKAWATAFVSAASADASDDVPALHAGLKQGYLRDLVGETYLVAAKAADKLRYLDPAQRLLALSLTCLLFWLGLLPVVAILVPSTPSKPSLVQLVPSTEAIPVRTQIAAPPSPLAPPTPSPTTIMAPANTTAAAPSTPSGANETTR